MHDRLVRRPSHTAIAECTMWWLCCVRQVCNRALATKQRHSAGVHAVATSSTLDAPAVPAWQVTTLLDKVEERGALQRLDPQQLEELKQRVSAQGSAVKEAKMVRIHRQP